MGPNEWKSRQIVQTVQVATCEEFHGAVLSTACSNSHDGRQRWLPPEVVWRAALRALTRAMTTGPSQTIDVQT